MINPQAGNIVALPLQGPKFNPELYLQSEMLYTCPSYSEFHHNISQYTFSMKMHCSLGLDNADRVDK